MNFKSRDYQHFPNARISLGIDVEHGTARVTLAATNNPGGDTFSRAAARNIINLRFDANEETLKALRLKRCVFTLPYEGKKPRNDVLRPLVKELGDHLKHREENHQWRGKVRHIIAAIRSFTQKQWKASKQSICS